MLKGPDVLAAFTALERSGLRPPPRWMESEEMYEGAVAIWRQVLADLTPVEFEAGVTAYMRSPDAKFWPMPGQILALAKPPIEDHADADWGLLCAAVARHGSYDPPATPERAGTWTLHPDDRRRTAIEAGIAALGGWSMLCATLRADDDNAPMRASFRTAYREQRRQVAAQVEAETVRQILAGGGVDLGRLLPGPSGPPPRPQLVTDGGRTLTPEERAERMRAHERRMTEAREQSRARGRAVKADASDA